MIRWVFSIENHGRTHYSVYQACTANLAFVQALADNLYAEHITCLGEETEAQAAVREEFARMYSEV